MIASVDANALNMSRKKTRTITDTFFGPGFETPGEAIQYGKMTHAQRMEQLHLDIDPVREKTVREFLTGTKRLCSWNSSEICF